MVVLYGCTRRNEIKSVSRARAHALVKRDPLFCQHIGPLKVPSMVPNFRKLPNRLKRTQGAVP